MIDWRNITDGSRISGFVANSAATSYFITWSGYSWERVFSQQRSFNSKSSGIKLTSNQTCSQFSVSPEHKGCRLCYHWSTSIFLKSCFKQKQYVPYGKERRKGEDWEGKKEKGIWGRSNCSKVGEVGTGVSKKLLDTADKKAKDAEKKKAATVMKALLIESNASRERAEQIQKKDIPAQDKEIKKIEEKIKKID